MYSLARTLFFGGAVGKIVGVLREVVFAGLFGTGIVAGAFRLSLAAFLIPVHGFMAETLSGAFAPRYSRLLEERGKAAAQELFFMAHWLLVLTAGAMALLTYLCASQWVEFLAPGFSPAASEMAADMVRAFGACIPSYLIFGLYSAVELCHGNAKLAAARSSSQSFGLMFGSLGAWIFKHPSLIVWGFFIFQTGSTLWAARVVSQRGISPFRSPASLARAWSECKIAGAQLKHLIWVPLVLQCQYIVERQVASISGDQAVAALDYAKYIPETGMWLLAVPLGLAALAAAPAMSKETLAKAVRRSLDLLLLVGVPGSALLFFCAEDIVRLVFQRGAFDDVSVVATSSILRGFALAMCVQMPAYIAGKFLCARGLSRDYLYSVIISGGISVSTSLTLGPVYGTPILGYSVLAGALISTPFLFWRLRVGISFGQSGVWVLGYLGAWVVDIFLAKAGGAVGVFHLVGHAVYWMLFIVLSAGRRNSLMEILKGVAARQGGN